MQTMHWGEGDEEGGELGGDLLLLHSNSHFGKQKNRKLEESVLVYNSETLIAGTVTTHTIAALLGACCHVCAVSTTMHTLSAGNSTFGFLAPCKQSNSQIAFHKMVDIVLAVYIINLSIQVILKRSRVSLCTTYGRVRWFENLEPEVQTFAFSRGGWGQP